MAVALPPTGRLPTTSQDQYVRLLVTIQANQIIIKIDLKSNIFVQLMVIGNHLPVFHTKISQFGWSINNIIQATVSTL